MGQARQDGGGGARAGRAGRAGAGAAALLALGLGACHNDAPTAQAEPSTTVESFAPDRPPAMASLPAAAAKGNAKGWNAAQIDWQPYEAGLARAKAQNKPVCLVFYADWCPHCRNYEHVFEDARVVERARDLVMVHLNADDETEVNKKFSADGGYVPRTYFLAPDGTVETDVRATHPRYAYFYDEHDPRGLLASMDLAVHKTGK